MHHQLQLSVPLLPPLLPAPPVLPTAAAAAAAAAVVAAVSLVLLPLAEARRGVHLVAVDTFCRTVVVSRRAGHTTSRSRLPLRRLKERKEGIPRRKDRKEGRKEGRYQGGINTGEVFDGIENIFPVVFSSVLEDSRGEKGRRRKERRGEREEKGSGEGVRRTLPLLPYRAAHSCTYEPRRVAGNIPCTLSFKGFLPSDVNARRSAGSHARFLLFTESSPVGVTSVVSTATFRVVPIPSSRFPMLSK